MNWQCFFWKQNFRHFFLLIIASITKSFYISKLWLSGWQITTFSWLSLYIRLSFTRSHSQKFLFWEWFLACESQTYRFFDKLFCSKVLFGIWAFSLLAAHCPNWKAACILSYESLFWQCDHSTAWGVLLVSKLFIITFSVC